jgi:hypothetical protein
LEALIANAGSGLKCVIYPSVRAAVVAYQARFGATQRL